MLDRQETFETVVRHLFNQGMRATEPGDLEDQQCRYRTEDGLKCAIGCLIRDEEYSTEMEGNTVSHLICFYLLPDRFDFKNNALFLSTLQTCHDRAINWRNTDTMKKAAMEIAQKFNLNADFLSELKFADR